MPREVRCPCCGLMVPVDASDEGADSHSTIHTARTIEMIVPATVASHDDLGSSTLGASWPEPVVPPASETVVYENPPMDLLGSSSTAESVPVPAVEPDVSRRPGMILVLLASYASALTLAILWLGLSGRWSSHRPEADPDVFSIHPGIRADHSRRVDRPEPLAPGRSTALGEPIRLGSLELTPLDIAARPVTLEYQRVDGRREVRRGGEDALWLRLRLRNVSEDLVFAPLDEAFLREPDQGLPVCFIELGDLERIYTYPLAVESEWAIEGQEFRDLKPGEVFEAEVVSRPDALDRLTGPATWRLRVRTGLDRLETIGIRFDPGQVRAADPTGIQIISP